MVVASSDALEISPDVLCQDVSGEMVLLDLKSESYFALDATGTRIWQLIREHGSLADVERRMLEEFEVDAATLRKDLQEHLEHLLIAGLIRRAGHATV